MKLRKGGSGPVSPTLADTGAETVRSGGTRAGSATTGKGRPTPKRGQVARGPVAAPPQTRKEAAQRKKEQATAARSRLKMGVTAGEEKYLTKRDAGPARALVRDIVDRRRNLGVLLLPLALLLVAAQIIGNRRVLDLAFSLWALGLAAIVADAAFTASAIRSAIRREHPDDGGTVGHVGYGLLRSTVLRRLRVPAPRVAPRRLRR